MSEIEYTRIKYSGTDAQIIDLVQQLLKSNGEISNPANEPTPPQVVPATPEPGVLQATTPNPEELQAIARRFSQLLDEAASRGSSGQKKAMRQWLLQNGRIEMKDLVSAAGVKDAKHYGPIAGALTRNMAKAGGPPRSCVGIAKFPRQWYGWLKNPTNGREEYILEEDLLPYLKGAFQIPD